MSQEYNKHWYSKRSENRPGKGIHLVCTLVTLEHIQCILSYVNFFMLTVTVFLLTDLPSRSTSVQRSYKPDDALRKMLNAFLFDLHFKQNQNLFDF